jgi:hypothetical protein
MLPHRRVASIALLSLLVIGSAHGSVYAGDKKNYGLINAHPKISKEVARQVKVRDGYGPDEKRVVVDYMIPPELGGAADLNNLRAIPKAQAKQRKEVEKKVLKQVKRGEITIGEARARVLYWQNYRNAPDTGVKIRR